MKNKNINFILVIAILLLVAWLAYDYISTDEPNVGDQTNIEQNGDDTTNNDSTTNNDNTNDEPQVDQEAKTESGRFMGRIDNNSIEVRISGVPDEIDPRVFRLSDEVKGMFDSLNLNEGDNIKFDFIVDENEQQTIVKVEKM